MARRLLGPANAASVLDTQGEDNVQNTQVTGDLSLEQGFRVTVLWSARTWTGQRWGLFSASAGEGTALKGRALCAGVWGFCRVMAEGENLSTIPLLSLICRNDLSREELQQLLHSTEPSACDRQGAAPWGSQVPTPKAWMQAGQQDLHLSLFRISNIGFKRSWPWAGIGWVLALPGGWSH